MSEYDWMDDCCESLIVPKITEVCLTGVFPSSNNDRSTVFVFRHPEDVANNTSVYEDIVWTYTSGAKFKPTRMVDNDGQIVRRAVSIGGIQLRSLVAALGGDPNEAMRWNRDQLVENMELCVGICVTSPMTGQQRNKDGDVTGIGFNFPKLDFTTPQTFTDTLNDNAESFGESELDLAIHTESARKRNTRPDDSVVPAGAEEGDEILG